MEFFGGKSSCCCRRRALAVRRGTYYASQERACEIRHRRLRLEKPKKTRKDSASHSFETIPEEADRSVNYGRLFPA